MNYSDHFPVDVLNSINVKIYIFLNKVFQCVLRLWQVPLDFIPGPIQRNTRWKCGAPLAWTAHPAGSTAALPGSWGARRAPCPLFNRTKQPQQQPSRTFGFPNAPEHGHFGGDGLRAAFVGYTKRIIAWLSRVVEPFAHSFGQGRYLLSEKVAVTSFCTQNKYPVQ